MPQRTPPTSLLAFFLVSLVIIAVGFVVLVSRFWLYAFGSHEALALRLSLVGMIVLVVLLLAALIGFILAHQLVSSIKIGRWEAAVLKWSRRWQEALLPGSAPPAQATSKAAIEAWLRLYEAALDREPLEKLARDGGVLQAMIRAVGSMRRVRVLGAIGELARARQEEGIAPLLAAAQTGDEAVQHGALRAAARSLAWAAPTTQERWASPFAIAMADSTLHSIPFEGVLLSLEGAAPLVVRELLSRPHQDLAPGQLRAVLAAARHSSPPIPIEGLGRLIDHSNPEIRAAALQTLAILGDRELVASESIEESLEAEREYLRIHATRAAQHLPRQRALGALWKRLGDSSWWVRVAAAETLALLGEEGLSMLERAAEDHPDRFARDMAGSYGAELARKAA